MYIGSSIGSFFFMLVNFLSRPYAITGASSWILSGSFLLNAFNRRPRVAGRGKRDNGRVKN